MLLIGAAQAFAQSPVERALAYLAIEAPKWPVENRCFSCHNNGDAARALLAGGRLAAVKSTVEFLADPSRWDQGKDSPGNDRRLATLQFAAALGDAVRMGVAPAASLTAAARLVVKLQHPEGSWRIEPDRDPGAPATWGTTLATALTVRVLEQAGGADDAARRARAWLARAEPRYTVDRAALVMSGESRHAAALVAAQTSDGGWGPTPKTPAEVFDTAVAVIALKRGAAVARGRAFLIAAQQSSGGWPETTRPAGSQSYAEHISTTGWAVLALLLTE